MSSVDVSIIIPAYNEESRLPRTLTQTIRFLKAQPYTSEIIVVTDGSKDQTAEVAHAFASQFHALSVLAFPFNRGKGFAVREGMLQARGKYRLFMDADYAVPVDYLTEFLDEAKDGFDIVIGSRHVSGALIEAQQKFPRRQLALAFGFLQWCILRLPFADTQCGFKLFSRDAAQKLFPLVTYDCAYFDAELIYLAHNMGVAMSQRPVKWSHDQETRLPIGFKRSVDLFCKLLNIRRLHARTIDGRINEELEKIIESRRIANLAEGASRSYAGTAQDKR